MRKHIKFLSFKLKYLKSKYTALNTVVLILKKIILEIYSNIFIYTIRREGIFNWVSVSFDHIVIRSISSVRT